MIVKPRQKRKNTRRTRRRHRGGTHNNEHHTVYPPKDINNYITRVLYINLDKRTDRRTLMENQLSVFEPDKVIRIPGVLHENGYYGCTCGHIAALKMAKKHKWPNVLILEDDAVWANVEKAYPVFQKLIEQPYDVIMLGGTYADYDINTYRVKFAYTTASYVAHESYYDTLIKALEDGINSNSPDKFAPDVTFSKLQPLDKWLLVRPALMVQRKNHSNIIGNTVNYRNGFKTKND